MKVIGSRTVWEGRFLRAVVLTYEDHTGAMREWEAIVRRECGGIVIVVPITRAGEIILIRQFRPALNRFVIELPAGLVGSGEDIMRAARRELIEETGHDAAGFETLTSSVMSTGINSELWHAVLARDASPAAEELLAEHPPDETENIEPVIVPLGALYDRMREFEAAGQYADIRIYGLVELARRALNGNGSA